MACRGLGCGLASSDIATGHAVHVAVERGCEAILVQFALEEGRALQEKVGLI